MKYNKNFGKECIKAWGEKSQIMLAIEEMSELTKELCKYIRRTENAGEYTDNKIAETISNIQEETADVLLTVSQMASLFGESEVERIQDEKTARCQKKLDDWKAKQGK